jgi:hypothetical protein
MGGNQSGEEIVAFIVLEVIKYNLFTVLLLLKL